MAKKKSSFHMGDEFNGNGKKTYLRATQHNTYAPLPQHNVRLTPNFSKFALAAIGAMPVGMEAAAAGTNAAIAMAVLGSVASVGQVIIDKEKGTGKYKTSYFLRKIALTTGSYLHSIGGSKVKLEESVSDIFVLSEEYIQWLRVAEGVELYPYRDMADSPDAQAAKTVTIGIGSTFNKESESWDSFKEILGWSDDDFKYICDTLFDANTTETDIKAMQEKYAITDDQALKILKREAYKKYIPAANEAIAKFKELYPDNNVEYSQRQMEAIIDFAYNSGESRVVECVDDPDYIVMYYLKCDQAGAVAAVERINNTKNWRRRINQMYLFFYDYNFKDNYKQHQIDLGFHSQYIK